MKKLKKDFVESISALGSLPFFLMVIFILFSLNKFSFALQMLIGIFLGQAITYLIRLIYYKDRPEPQKFSSIIGRIDASSFPSLHSVRAMTFVFICVMNIKSLTAYAGFGVYLLAVLFSRYYLKKHDLRDIMGGAVIGFFIGYAVMFFPF